MNDLISRQAAIELILSGKVGDDSTEWVGVECPEECNSFLDWAAEEVGKMPSAERKKGRWIWSESEWQYECSSCGSTFDYNKTYELFDHGFQLANYCPNCGAEMRGEQDE